MAPREYGAAVTSTRVGAALTGGAGPIVYRAAKAAVIHFSRGAAIDLAKDAACPYCRAPVAVLDPDALGQTVAALSAAESARHRIDPVAMADALMEAGRFNHTLADRAPGGNVDAIVAAIQLGATALDILFNDR